MMLFHKLEMHLSPLILYLLVINPERPICKLKLGNPYIFGIVYSRRWFSKNQNCQKVPMSRERSQKHFRRDVSFECCAVIWQILRLLWENMKIEINETKEIFFVFLFLNCNVAISQIFNAPSKNRKILEKTGKANCILWPQDVS